jgi:hypothetical protein
MVTAGLREDVNFVEIVEVAVAFDRLFVQRLPSGRD